MKTLPRALSTLGHACKLSSARWVVDCAELFFFSIARLISSWRHGWMEEIKSWLAFSIQKLHEVSSPRTRLEPWRGCDIRASWPLLPRQVASAAPIRTDP